MSILCLDVSSINVENYINYNENYTSDPQFICCENKAVFHHHHTQHDQDVFPPDSQYRMDFTEHTYVEG